jgi:hypothetical protein
MTAVTISRLSSVNCRMGTVESFAGVDEEERAKISPI